MAPKQTRPYRDETFLRQKYIADRLTIDEIADDCGVDYATVHYWLEKHGIERRRRGNERVPYAWFGSDSNGYERWQAKIPRSRSNEFVYVHRLAAVAWFGWEAVVGNDVHHDNEIKWDTRESNIYPLGKGEHAALHARRRRAE